MDWQLKFYGDRFRAIILESQLSVRQIVVFVVSLAIPEGVPLAHFRANICEPYILHSLWLFIAAAAAAAD